MKRRHLLTAVLAVGIATSTVLVTTARAGNVGFNVAIGGPGFGVNVGSFGWSAFVPGPVFFPRPVIRPAVVAFAPAPVWVQPGFGPVYAPAPVVFGPPVVAVRGPVVRPVFRPVYVSTRPFRPAPRYYAGWNNRW